MWDSGARCERRCGWRGGWRWPRRGRAASSRRARRAAAAAAATRTRASGSAKWSPACASWASTAPRPSGAAGRARGECCGSSGRACATAHPALPLPLPNLPPPALSPHPARVLDIWTAKGATNPDALRQLFVQRSLSKSVTLLIQLALDGAASAGAFYTGASFAQSRVLGDYTLAAEYGAYFVVGGALWRAGAPRPVPAPRRALALPPSTPHAQRAAGPRGPHLADAAAGRRQGLLCPWLGPPGHAGCDAPCRAAPAPRGSNRVEAGGRTLAAGGPIPLPAGSERRVSTCSWRPCWTSLAWARCWWPPRATRPTPTPSSWRCSRWGDGRRRAREGAQLAAGGCRLRWGLMGVAGKHRCWRQRLTRPVQQARATQRASRAQAAS